MDYLDFTRERLTINTKSLKLEYKEDSGNYLYVVHWGQRKLLLSEIEFFTLYLSKEMENPICVYAGAAHGNHIPLLSTMFPAITFHLYDPAKFNIEENDKIKIFNEYFTDDIAKSYRNQKNIFFLSDIRTSDYEKIKKEHLAAVGITKFDNKNKPIGPYDLIKKAEKEALEEHERIVWSDMEMQQQWVLLMNPLHCLIKFRLPWPVLDKNKQSVDRKVKYLKGTAFWQLWNRSISTETRLKPVKNENGEYEISEWSIMEYEQFSFYQNTVIRRSTSFKNNLTNDDTPLDYPELLNDFDSTAEIEILKMYLQAHSINDNNIALKLSRLITETLNNYQNKSKTLSDHRSSLQMYDAFAKKGGNNLTLPTTTPLLLSATVSTTMIRPSLLPKSLLPTTAPTTTVRSPLLPTTSPTTTIRSSLLPNPLLSTTESITESDQLLSTTESTTIPAKRVLKLPTTSTPTTESPKKVIKLPPKILVPSPLNKELPSTNIIRTAPLLPTPSTIKK